MNVKEQMNEWVNDGFTAVLNSAEVIGGALFLTAAHCART